MTRLENRIKNWLIRRWNLAEQDKVAEDIETVFQQVQTRADRAFQLAINAYPREKQNELKVRYSRQLQQIAENLE